MSKYEQRYRGYKDHCRFCQRKLKAATLVVLELLVTDHERKCEAEQRAKQEREANAAAARAAQPDLFGGKP